MDFHPISFIGTKKFFILVFVLLILSAIFYFAFGMGKEDIQILKIEVPYQVKQAGYNDRYVLEAKCVWVSNYTIAPYVTVHQNGFELLSTAVNSGYDTARDCLQSSVKGVSIDQVEKEISINMQDGSIKKIELIGMME